MLKFVRVTSYSLILRRFINTGKIWLLSSLLMRLKISLWFFSDIIFYCIAAILFNLSR